MSANLKSSADYVRLLLTSSRKQARLLIKHADTKQIDALCEIGVNLLTLSVPVKVKRLIQKCKKYLKKLGKKHLSSKGKLRIILSHLGAFISILIAIRPILLEILQ